jgi:predicted ester cyclase
MTWKRGGAVDAADNEQIARDLIIELWAGNTDAADEHPGYWNTIHTFGILRVGFPDLTVTMQRQLSVGDIVVTQLGLAGTHQGPFFGAAPTGERVEWTIVYIDTIRDGKVVEHASGDGWLDLLIGIGAIPPPG